MPLATLRANGLPCPCKRCTRCQPLAYDTGAMRKRVARKARIRRAIVEALTCAAIVASLAVAMFA
jgi:hypothetical protein